jgi:hypothetical protein
VKSHTHGLDVLGAGTMGIGIKDGRGYGPYGTGYSREGLPLGPGGEVLPSSDYDYQPGSTGNYLTGRQAPLKLARGVTWCDERGNWGRRRIVPQLLGETGGEANVAATVPASSVSSLNAGTSASSSASVSTQVRYEAAMKYVSDQLVSWTANHIGAAFVSVTEPYVNDYTSIKSRWAAANDSNRSAIMLEAEALANRVQQTMPGATMGTWRRTNLDPGETPRTTPDISYAKEVKGTAAEQAAAVQAAAAGMKKKLEDTFKWPWWGTALIVSGLAVGAAAVLTPILVPVLTARADRARRVER